MLSSDCKSFSWPPVEFYPQDAPLFLYSDNLITVQDIKKRGLTLHPTPRIALFVDSLHRLSLFLPHLRAWGKSRGLTRISRALALCGKCAENMRRMHGEYAYFPRIFSPFSTNLEIKKRTHFFIFKIFLKLLKLKKNNFNFF